MPLVVDPDLKLHLITDEVSLKKACTGRVQPVELAKNLRQLLGWTGSGGPSGKRDQRRETDNWQQLVDVQYIQADGKAEVLAVVGKISNKHRLACAHGCALAEKTLANVLNMTVPKAKKDGVTWK